MDHYLRFFNLERPYKSLSFGYLVSVYIQVFDKNVNPGTTGTLPRLKFSPPVFRALQSYKFVSAFRFMDSPLDFLYSLDPCALSVTYELAKP